MIILTNKSQWCLYQYKQDWWMFQDLMHHLGPTFTDPRDCEELVEALKNHFFDSSFIPKTYYQPPMSPVSTW